MNLQLDGAIYWNTGMWHHRIFQIDDKFILLEQSEMMEDSTRTEFTDLQEAIKEMLSHT